MRLALGRILSVCPNIRSLSSLPETPFLHPPSSKIPKNSFFFTKEAITIEEEEMLIEYLDSKLKSRKYQGSHWDNVISRYREIELQDSDLTEELRIILNNVKNKIDAFFDEKIHYLPAHVIDLGILKLSLFFSNFA
jgi:hypothetical protein